MAAPTLLQGGSGAPLNASRSGVGTTVVKAFGSNVTAGSLLIALVWYYSATASVSTVIDTQLNTWVMDVGPSGVGAGNSHWTIWSTIAGSSSANTVTATMSASGVDAAIALFEVQYSATPAFDSGATNTGTGTTPNAGTITPANAESFSVSGQTNSSGAPTAVAPWTKAADLSFFWFDAYMYRADNGAGAHSCAWTAGAKSNWTAAGATYSCTGGGGGSAIKTLNGLAKASNKTVNGLAIASMKTRNGLA